MLCVYHVGRKHLLINWKYVWYVIGLYAQIVQSIAVRGIHMDGCARSALQI